MGEVHVVILEKAPRDVALGELTTTGRSGVAWLVLRFEGSKELGFAEVGEDDGAGVEGCEERTRGRGNLKAIRTDGDLDDIQGLITDREWS